MTQLQAEVIIGASGIGRRDDIDSAIMEAIERLQESQCVWRMLRAMNIRGGDPDGMDADIERHVEKAAASVRRLSAIVMGRAGRVRHE